MRPILSALLLSLAGCAAMQRRWEFSAENIASPLARVEVDEVIVRQKDLTVRLRIIAEQGGTLRLDDPRILFEESGDLEGRASVWEGSPLAWFRPEQEVVLNPGGSAELRLWFHTPARDLRRAPRYRLELGACTLDGQALALPPLWLVAPPEAPVGDRP